MWNNIAYGFLYIWVKLHALLPMKVLYILSDILYVLVYKLVGYRVKVVHSNMQRSFPEKPAIELRRLERAFYHHFCDYIVETIKLAHLSVEEAQARAYVKNPELLDQLTGEADGSIIMLMGHYGNWEWFTSANPLLKETTLYQIYRPLSNQAFDRLFIKLRTRYGSKGIRKNDTMREMVHLKKNKTRAAVIFLADQTPNQANLHYWTTFLNQPSAMLTGAEKIARKQHLPVVFLDVQKVKRGYYMVEIKLITRTPQHTPEFWLTEEYTRRLEHMILRNPAYWLWTHKRWKYKQQKA
ncbi:MAG: lysophospholipid acyltransferase family protein [Tannerellaceae bacterium]|nr:lysophospholipid acyltransferase family protein [Tannerellaceae bacterium]